MTTHHCDVLVIGSGGAALRAALAAREENPRAQVLIATKGQMGTSGVTATACSDRMAFQATLPYTEPTGPDNWRYHAEDIFCLGGFVSDRDLADLLAQHSADAFGYLDGLGVPFVRDPNGRPSQFLTDGSRYARACYTGPYTANDIEAALVGRVRDLSIPVVEYCTVAELLVYRGRVIGAVGLVGEDWVGFCAQAVVLATGGGGEAFRASVFPPEATGDGYAMAYRAGAELVNTEFVQIGLCSIRTKLALSGSILRCVPRVVDEQGREFLYDYFPSEAARGAIHNMIFRKGSAWPVSSDDVTSTIDVAVFKKLLKGERVFLDFGENAQGFALEALDEESQRRYEQEIEVNLGSEQRGRSPLCRLEEINPRIIEWLGQRGVDLRGGDRIEIAPAAQHFQGGVKIRSDARSTIRGLYAAGECAGGQHGANRPGGNSLLDCQVFGKIAGTQAARAASKQAASSGQAAQLAQQRCGARLERRLGRGIAATQARGEIQDVLSECASVVRTERGLEAGLDRTARLKAEGIRADERGRSYALETQNMLCLAEMLMGAAKLRRESRGPHLFFERFDDPRPLGRDEDGWRRYIVVRRGTEGMQFEAREPVGAQST